MPCGGPDDTIFHQGEKIDQLTGEVKSLTRMLCWVCRGSKVKLSPKIAKWWTQHQKEDKKRLRESKRERKEEEERKSALRKLSRKERCLLGLD